MEIILGATIMSLTIVALLGAFFGQSYLNLHARSLAGAMNDATRVMELIRQRNVGCTRPTAQPPTETSWDAWLAAQAGAGGKSLPAVDAQSLERVAVTCQNEAGTAYCGPNQVGGGEWAGGTGADTTFDPLRITVSVGWRTQQRTVGGTAVAAEFTYQPPTTVGCGKGCTQQLPGRLDVGPDADADGVVESQAMLTTLVTCR